MPTRPTIFATNDILTANDLNSLAGVWNAYTPTLGGFTPGNGVASGSYLQFGKLVIFRASFVLGTTSVAATVAPSLTLPVAAIAVRSVAAVGIFMDTGGGSYNAITTNLLTTNIGLYVPGTNGAYNTATTTVPFTWAATDAISVMGFYEAA